MSGKIRCSSVLFGARNRHKAEHRYGKRLPAQQLPTCASSSSILLGKQGSSGLDYVSNDELGVQ